jgi:hypothetical protein
VTWTRDTPVDEGDPRPAEATQPRQRAVWSVPTADSLVALGAGGYAPAGNALTAPGFTANTTRHVFLRAAGAVSFQAQGQTWFQSVAGPLCVVSGASTYLVAKADAYVGGRAYVGFMAGFAGAPIDGGSDYSAATPETRPPVEQVNAAFTASEIAWRSANQVITTLNRVKSTEHRIRLGKYQGVSAKLQRVPLLWEAYHFYSVIDESVALRPERGISMFAEAGIQAGTPAFMTTSGFAGTSCRGANVTLLGHLGATVASMLLTVVDSVYGTTAFFAGSELSALARQHVVFNCTLGQASLLGREIEIGSARAEGEQPATKEVQIEAVSEVSVESRTLEIVATRKGGRVEVEATEAMRWSAANRTELRAGSWEVVGSPGKIAASGPKGTLLELGPSGVQLGPPSGRLKLAPGSADLGKGALRITDSGITAMGGHVELL